MATTHEYGKDYRIKISDGGSSPTFANLGGEGTFTVSRSSDKIDFSSKDDGKIKAAGWGQGELMIKVQGKLKLPDPGMAKVYSVNNADVPEIEMQIVKGATVVFRCMMGIGNLNLDYANNAAVPYSFDASAMSAPTVDTLVA